MRLLPSPTAEQGQPRGCGQITPFDCFSLRPNTSNMDNYKWLDIFEVFYENLGYF